MLPNKSLIGHAEKSMLRNSPQLANYNNQRPYNLPNLPSTQYNQSTPTNTPQQPLLAIDLFRSASPNLPRHNTSSSTSCLSVACSHPANPNTFAQQAQRTKLLAAQTAYRWHATRPPLGTQICPAARCQVISLNLNRAQKGCHTLPPSINVGPGRLAAARRLTHAVMVAVR